jgi:hypothetical protein
MAAVVLVVAVDVLRVGRSVTRDDIRFDARQTIPEALWSDPGIAPGGVARWLTGVDDDIRYRKAVWLYSRVQPGKVVIQGSVLEGLRGSAASALTDASFKTSDPVDRSQLLNLLGILTLDRYSSDAANRINIVNTAAGFFQSAIESDPDNADAKFNLELVLRDFVTVDIPGEEPDRGADLGRQGAEGRSGSGY